MSTTLTQNLSNVELLEMVLRSLRQQEEEIRKSGPVAPVYIWIDKNFVKGKQYAKLRSDRDLEEWGNRPFRHLGRVGCAEHRDWAARVNRRLALQEIERRILLIQDLVESFRCDEWRPLQPDSNHDLWWTEYLDGGGKRWFYEKGTREMRRTRKC